MSPSVSYLVTSCGSRRGAASAVHEARPPERPKPRLLDRVRAALRLRHLQPPVISRLAVFALTGCAAWATADRTEMVPCGQHQREPTDRLYECMRLGAQAYDQGRYDDAERMYLAGIEHAQGVQGWGMLLEGSHTLLGEVYYAQRKYGDAERAFQRAVAMLGERGTGHSVPRAWQGLGKVYLAQGKHAEAETHFKSALAIRERAQGPSHPDVAAILDDLATLYRATGRPNEAAEVEARARAIRATPR